jgi:hypothetical protein
MREAQTKKKHPRELPVSALSFFAENFQLLDTLFTFVITESNLQGSVIRLLIG